MANGIKETPFFHSSIMMNKEIVDKCDFYNQRLFISQDALLFNLMTKYGELRYIFY